ncbi:hypothetical protein GCM10010977_07080 [Citricoccus zhacaiensis]|uniref:ATPase AAA-type core domain-containing protein n=1 Tax=Citricoccus zhacaiensis TaxID=489142 RepID=A0ABQ2LQZ0_9MICC|nr:hypothetical protein [Citricoccus zhacaiensis]GGO42100.1 hypothetical protein GCM10010977_07080 [Citricoccus zhacaiensis]
MFIAPTEVVLATTADDLQTARTQAGSWRSKEMGIPDRYLSDAALADLAAAAESVQDAGFARAVMAVQSARAGDFAPIPNINSAVELFREFLKDGLIDGWLYVQEPDGYLHPYLVMDIGLDHGDRTRPPRIKITMEADNPTVKRPSRAPRLLQFDETELVGKTPADVLTAHRAFKETERLRAEYQERRDAFQDIIDHDFGQQFVFTGRAMRTEDYRSAHDRTHRKVVHDVAPDERAPLRMVASSVLFDEQETGAVPVVTAVRVFDLAAQDYLDVNTADLTRYEYNPGLRDKLVLPDDQRELLDILTSDISVFTGDIIEGKSAGNVILARGRPGVGKTLTAEVYAEVIGRPLYSIHTGSLGIPRNWCVRTSRKSSSRPSAGTPCCCWTRPTSSCWSAGSNCTRTRSWPSSCAPSSTTTGCCSSPRTGSTRWTGPSSPVVPPSSTTAPPSRMPPARSGRPSPPATRSPCPMACWTSSWTASRTSRPGTSKCC